MLDHGHDTQNPKAGLLNLAFNVLIPVIILHKLSNIFGPLPTLLLALAFPLGYGIKEFVQKKKLNPLSLLGFLNVTVTGGLAVLGLGGIWFSIKEAFFPSLVAVFVIISAFSETPFIRTVFLNPQVMDVEKIETSLISDEQKNGFQKHLRTSTIFLAGSFFISAGLNFVLSLRIFTDLPETMNAEEKAIALNLQIATMTKWSFAVILLPSMLCLGFIMWYLLSGIRKLTGLKNEEFLKS